MHFYGVSSTIFGSTRKMIVQDFRLEGNFLRAHWGIPPIDKRKLPYQSKKQAMTHVMYAKIAIE